MSSEKKYKKISSSNYSFANKNFGPFLMEEKEINVYKKIYNS